jgi:uroporphyrinogen decarboxylase
MSGRSLFIDALNGVNQSGRPPLWVMRQAGRYLPEYRALKEKHTFLEMVKNPELATEVTLQPLRRFKLDAAIVFSDILVIPEAMGQGYDFRNGGGIEMTSKIESEKDIDQLSAACIQEKLGYVSDTLKILRKELGESQALLGFCGSPWTLACYMIEGGSANGFPKALSWAKEQPASFQKLLEKISDALVEYLKMQASCGVDALQIFDSWHNLCPTDHLWDYSLHWIQKVIENIPSELAIIVYANASEDRLCEIKKTGTRALGVHHSTDLTEVRKRLPAPLVLQGNLAPELMETNASQVAYETNRILDSMKDDPAHIMNLGHGIRPNAKIECMQALVDSVLNYGNC